MSNFLFHELSEKEREEINKQVKKIVNDFSKQLEKVKEKIVEENVEEEKNQRVEDDVGCNEIDREIMFDNAPDKSEDFIIAERKKW